MTRNLTKEIAMLLNVARKKGDISVDDVKSISMKMKAGLDDYSVLNSLVKELHHRNAEMGSLASPELVRIERIISN